jgi:phenylpropionate dioxygenase-like ring-hydroxylating dioxygenase large terminal subunit
MTYLRNAWYMIGWADEVGEAPLVRTVLEMPILVYRKQQTKEAVALIDRCPHRFAPLSLGRRIGDDYQCGYHGLRFNSDGLCVYNHFAKAIPSAAKVRTFPVFEQDHMIWVWTGTGAPASTATIPRFEFHTDPAKRNVFGTTLTRADYRLISDNLMDLTHTAFLHPEFGGESYVPKCKTWEEDGAIVVDHLIPSMPDIYSGSGTITETDRMRWNAPATHYLESHVTMLDESRLSFMIPSAHVLTPESLTTTHYFWSSALDHDSPMSNDELIAALRRAFDGQDKPMLEAVQERMQGHELWDLNPVMMPTDTGGVLVRRRLQKLIDAESQAAAVKTA